jgi:hypothetical protein
MVIIADRPVALWDLADECAAKSKKDPTWHWLRMMDAFWNGELAPDGLVFRSLLPDEPGCESNRLEREVIAAHIVGVRRTKAPGNEKSTLWEFGVPLQTFLSWTVTDYQRLEPPLCNYFARDREGRLGLAIEREEYERWEKSDDSQATLRGGVRRRRQIASQQLRIWTQGLVDQHRETKKPLSKAKIWQLAHDEFGQSVTRENVWTVYEEIAPIEWQRQGRRKAVGQTLPRYENNSPTKKRRR